MLGGLQKPRANSFVSAVGEREKQHDLAIARGLFHFGADGFGNLSAFEFASRSQRHSEFGGGGGTKLLEQQWKAVGSAGKNRAARCFAAFLRRDIGFADGVVQGCRVRIISVREETLGAEDGAFGDEGAIFLRGAR